MSEYIFKLPDLGEGTVEAEIADWMVKLSLALLALIPFRLIVTRLDRKSRTA